MVDQDDFTAGFGDARKFVEGRLGVSDRSDDELGDHRIEGRIAKAEILRIHNGEGFDMRELTFGDALARLAQHRLAVVDADDAIAGGIVDERNAGAYTHVQDAAADPLGSGYRGLATLIEHLAEDEIVDR